MNAITSTLSPNISQDTKNKIANFIRYTCLFLFVYTAYAKIVEHKRFLNGLKNVHLISSQAELISYLVPGLEVVVAVMLIIPKTIKIGLISFSGMMVGFTGYIISAMIWEPHLPCHCGGAIERLSWMQHIWFNLAFIMLAIIAVRISKFSNY
ncbi:hypothetical protein GWR56_06825 [Mucilaginibacter sp. 14171R-50]|uniref:MauE/DoxX family redox-associated membrane protein n=1 Tax=Mucilaginibacter sp. 14171R-50 TaxID=2703789 RepID=UPI00138D25B7|nr:MauE/DoxX family redox-associated membrane protein [Mucilaginibacter sp. 14171R-50]QHS55267.1 hypothetical protein GWR56_06825 [Mucilaginibacter sp. 14171R-50]